MDTPETPTQEPGPLPTPFPSDVEINAWTLAAGFDKADPNGDKIDDHALVASVLAWERARHEAEVAALRSEVERSNAAERELLEMVAYWREHHQTYFARIGEAIGEGRKRRDSGDPARSDFQEIEALHETLATERAARERMEDKARRLADSERALEAARERAEAERDHAIEMEARAVRRAEDAEESAERAERREKEAREREEKWWGVLCETAGVFGLLVPETAPYLANHARKIAAAHEETRRALEQLRSEVVK